MRIPDFLRNTFEYPWVVERLLWSHPFFWVPPKDTFQELQEQPLLDWDDLLQFATKPWSELGCLHFLRKAEILVEEFIPAFGHPEHGLGWEAQRAH